MNVGGGAPDIHYAKSGGLNIAFSVVGAGPDLVVAPGFISHLDIMWEEPSVAHFYSRLASFRRVGTFDKRGTGLSDPTTHAPTLEESIDDLRAVMDAAGCTRADVRRVHRRPASRHGRGRMHTRRPRGHFGGRRNGDADDGQP